jgi:RHS repeat-associated protein
MRDNRRVGLGLLDCLSRPRPLVGSTNKVNRFIFEETVWLGDIPVGTIRPNGGGVSIFYVHTDHLNTPRRVSRPSDNAILWRWDSDPFGSTAANEDPDADSTLFKYHLRFPGQYADQETGLSYNYFRDYDSATGRYLPPDPAGQRLFSFLSTLSSGARHRGYWNKLYVYVDDNPLMRRDPSGLGPLDWFLDLFREKAPEQFTSKAIGGGLAPLCIIRNCGKSRDSVELYGDCASFLSDLIEKHGKEVIGLIGGITGDAGQAAIAECAELCAKGIKSDSCCKGAKE